MGDWLTAGSVGEVASRAGQRKSRLHLLPYGIPLCIGFVGYLVYLDSVGTQAPVARAGAVWSGGPH